jgi:hypothetical protein
MTYAEKHDDDGLAPFEGEQVVESRIEIPSAAGGFQEAMAFDPIQLHRGDEVFVLMHLRCAKVRHEPVDEKDTGPHPALRRVHILKPAGKDSAMFVERSDVEQRLKARQETLRLLRERAGGVFRLDLAEGEEPDEQESDDEE